MEVIDTRRFLDDAVKNLVVLLDTNKNSWGVKLVSPFQQTMKSIFPCLIVNAMGSTFDRIESGGGYMVDISLDVIFCFQEFNENFAKEILDQRTSEIALFIASRPSLGGYAEDVIIEGTSIAPLPEQRRGVPLVMSVISCRVKKEIFLEYE